MSTYRSTPANGKRSATRLALVAFSLLVASSLALPVLAGGRHHDNRKHHKHQKHHKHHREHHREHHRHAGPAHPAPHAGPSRGRARFVVPDYLPRAAQRDWQPYYHGRVHFAAHHHSHSVYLFPFWTEVGWVDSPVEYCEGHRFDSPPVPIAPRLSVELNF